MTAINDTESRMIPLRRDWFGFLRGKIPDLCKAVLKQAPWTTAGAIPKPCHVLAKVLCARHITGIMNAPWSAVETWELLSGKGKGRDKF